MEPFGASYLLESADQFWTELDDILKVKPLASLLELDTSFKSYIALAACYCEDYLQDGPSLRQCVDNVLASRLFVNHSQRMTDLAASLLRDGEQSAASILFCSVLLLRYGQAHPHVFRQLRFAHGTPPDSPLPDDDAPGPSSSRPKPAGIISVLLVIGERVGFAMDHFVAGYHPGHRNSYGPSMPPVATPSVEEMHKEMSLETVRQTERRLGPVLAELLYELCRVQKLERELLELFNERRVGRFFELVELTRDLEDETFNYNLIKLIIALNEQFMVAGLPSPGEEPGAPNARKSKRSAATDQPFANVVLKIMKERLDESKTFGENLIFILNRSSHETAEGLCVSLLILKILYLLFTTTGTHDYFYTNDLCVLVDVFVRELNNLPEESEGLRHTYLRVLHPLLTHTQLRTYPYKRAEIRHVLLSHIQYAHLRDISATTKRLVDRNLKAEWCLELSQAKASALPSSPGNGSAFKGIRSQSIDTLAGQSTHRGSVTDVTTAASAVSAPDFKSAVAAIRHHEAVEDQLRSLSNGTHPPAVTSSPPRTSFELDGSPDLEQLQALSIASPVPRAKSASYESGSFLRPVLLPSRSRSAPSTPPPQEPPGSPQAADDLQSRSRALTLVNTECAPVHRRPPPLPPTTRRNGEPVGVRESPRSPSSAVIASPLSDSPSAPSGQFDPPVQRRRPPSPPIDRRRPPSPPPPARRKAPLPPGPSRLSRPPSTEPRLRQPISIVVPQTSPEDQLTRDPFTDSLRVA